MRIPPLASPSLLRRLTLLCLLALAAAACGVTGTGDPSTAAVVGDVEIPIEEVEQGVVDAEANPQVAQALEGDESGEVRAGMEAQLLTSRIRSELVAQGAEDLGITVTEEDIAAERETLIEQTGGQEAFEQALAESGLSEEEIDRRLRDQLLQQRVLEEIAPEITEEEVATRLEEDYVGAARHILVETEEEAQDVVDQLNSGADFGELAQETSTDPSAAQNSGDLGLIPVGQTVPEFEEAVASGEPGEIVGPIETQFGFHVIEVYEPDQQVVEDQIRGEALQESGQAALQGWLAEQAEEIGVEVNPVYGEWEAETAQVVSSEPLEGDGGASPAPTGPDAPATPAPTPTE